MMVSFQNKHQKFEMLKKNKQASVPSFVSDVLCALNRRNEKKPPRCSCFSKSESAVLGVEMLLTGKTERNTEINQTSDTISCLRPLHVCRVNVQ